MADRNLESGCYNEDNGDGEPDLSNSVPDLGFFFFFFFGRHAKPESVPRRDRVCHLCYLGAVEDENHLLLVCRAHHDIRCKFGQQLGKQLTPCSLLPELMHSAN